MTSLTVTGSPATPAFLAARIRTALDRLIAPTLAPGAGVSYGAVSAPVLWPGASATVNVAVTIVGPPDVGTVSGTTTVAVSDLPLPPPSPSILFFDDDPEYVTDDGVLSRSTVDAAHPARLYFYHDVRGLAKNLTVILTAAAASRVQFVDVAGGPDVDVMSVGHDVSRDFVLAEAGDEGEVIDLAPGAPLVLHRRLALPGELVAGALDVRVLAGGPVSATVLSSPPGIDPLPFLDAPPATPDGHARHGAFALDGFGTTRLAYTAGGPDVAYVFGDADASPRNLDPRDPGRDVGDYGVVQHIAVELENPTDAPQSVYLYETARGGVVRSSFLVDGVVHELGCARVPARYAIATYVLPPHTQLGSTVLTMADGGSNFPLEVGLTATPPLPETPPQDAPDGCFPKPER